ncbi:class I adenylate-forming enzyme family protein [Salinispora cortesiana]|uniref:class I adenylate-forming enzyme family protein n=1 Tax=Salinispora cortesiana TaxID=1305843 RepID=UPI0009B7C8E5|nr:class I adenylate-forming enzyme family protein [Salinispora cortesiana]
MPHRLLEARASAAANDPALHTDEETITYLELWHDSARWAQQLQENGVQPTWRVLVSLDQPRELLAAIFGIWRVGAIPVPFDSNRPANHFTAVVADALVRATITEGGVGLLPQDDVQSKPDRWRLVLATTGSTGRPKIVTFTGNQLLANAESTASILRWRAGDVCLTPVSPVFPAVLITCVLSAFHVGASVYLTNQRTPRSLVNVLLDSRATSFFAVPYVYEHLILSQALKRLQDAPHLRLCISSSAPTRSATANEFFTSTGLVLRSMYCSSEAGNCTFNDAEDPILAQTSVGRALPGVLVSVIDELGNQVSPGVHGRIRISGDLIAERYGVDPDEGAFPEAGISTHDFGFLDANDFLHLLRRDSDLVNCAGFEVNLAEVTAAIQSHPLVHDVVVRGEKDPVLTTRIVAEVVSNVSLSAQELSAYIGNALSGHEVPQVITFVGSIDRNGLGKVPGVSAGGSK